MAESERERNYVKAPTGDVYFFDEHDPTGQDRAVEFLRAFAEPGKLPRGAAWKPWPGMPVWLRVIGA